MKRYGEKAIIQALQNGYRIRYNEWFVLNAGYRVIDNNGNIVGFITFDLWCKLLHNGVIICSEKGYTYDEYTLR